MNLADTLRGLWRRWYIVIPGILLAAALAAGAWSVIPPGYERSSAQLLIPGESSMPEGANPYLFLGGLTPAADVLVRAVGSENEKNDVIEEYPGVEIKVTRDVSTAGPVILIAVTATSDADAEEVLGLVVNRTETLLDELQESEKIAATNRVTLLPVTVDSQSLLDQRNRFLAVAGVGLAGTALTLIVASLVEGLSVKRKRRGEVGGEAEGADRVPEPDYVDDEPARGTGPARTTVTPVDTFEPVDYDSEPDGAASPAHSSR